MNTTPTLDRDIVALLREWRAGDRVAGNALFELLYAELRAVALHRAPADATALVHDAFVRLQNARVDCEDRREFLGLVGTVMRRLLIDAARRQRIGRRALAERGHREFTTDQPSIAFVMRLDAALEQLGACDAELMRVVECRFLIGMSVAETATELEVSTATVKRAWRTARAFLQREIENDAQA